MIVDYQICFIGGLDLCFGRYDTFEHKVGDNPPLIWPGKDYYNPRYISCPNTSSTCFLFGKKSRFVQSECVNYVILNVVSFFYNIGVGYLL